MYVYETDDIDNIEKCVKTYAKQYQYRKYKEVYKVNINIIKKIIKDCKKVIYKYKKDNITKEQKGGNIYIYIEYI